MGTILHDRYQSFLISGNYSQVLLSLNRAHLAPQLYSEPWGDKTARWLEHQGRRAKPNATEYKLKLILQLRCWVQICLTVFGALNCDMFTLYIALFVSALNLTPVLEVSNSYVTRAPGCHFCLDNFHFWNTNEERLVKEVWLATCLLWACLSWLIIYIWRGVMSWVLNVFLKDRWPWLSWKKWSLGCFWREQGKGKFLSISCSQVSWLGQLMVAWLLGTFGWG